MPFPQTFKEDGGIWGAPLFVEYFGYDHSASVPANTQLTQDGHASVPLQPNGSPWAPGATTVVSWTVPSGLWSATIASSPHAETISLAAQAASSGSVVSCSYAATYDDGYSGVQTLTVGDDTAETPDPRDKDNLTLTNQVSGHLPDTTGIDSYAIVALTPWFTGGASAGRDYTMNLLDSDGALFPGVWIQERFVSSTLP